MECFAECTAFEQGETQKLFYNNNSESWCHTGNQSKIESQQTGAQDKITSTVEEKQIFYPECTWYIQNREQWAKSVDIWGNKN